LKIRDGLTSRMFDWINIVLILLLIIVMVYPFLYVVSASLSNPLAFAKGEVYLLPKGFTLAAYKKLAVDPTIWLSYYNTIVYTIVQTAISLLLTALFAYPLSKKRLVARRKILMFVAFTMLFGGGIIPTFLLVKSLGLLNTIWAIVIPSAINTWYLFIMRSFFMTSIPEDIEEAAFIDGANTLAVLLRIVIPLSMPVFATIGLFTAVAQWNNFFEALIYLTNRELYPLQIHLRNIVISGSSLAEEQVVEGAEENVSETIKYAVIMFATLPIMLVYPFIQKYFVQGAMVGGIKG
jgi:putative aldouronate transport system permease protein